METNDHQFLRSFADSEVQKMIVDCASRLEAVVRRSISAGWPVVVHRGIGVFYLTILKAVCNKVV